MQEGYRLIRYQKIPAIFITGHRELRISRNSPCTADVPINKLFSDLLLPIKKLLVLMYGRVCCFDSDC